tara:strand:- start:2386 stop:3840 length:1455 start_codon:yes stop_codon:yes gene_type:complete
MNDLLSVSQAWFLNNEGLLSSMAAMLAVVSGLIFWFSRIFGRFGESLSNRFGKKIGEKKSDKTPQSLVTKASNKVAKNKQIIAVLPFRTLTNNGDEEYLATGIAEDIITSMSYSRLFPVISSATSFSYKNSKDIFGDISRDLNAKYVVTGTIGHGLNLLNLTVELADCDSQTQLWSEKFSSKATDLFHLQEQVSERIIGKLSPALRSAKMGHARRAAPNSPDAWDHVLRGLWLQSQSSSETNLDAIKEFQSATEMDVEFGYSYALLAYAYHLRSYMGWSTNFTDDLKSADKYALKAISLDSEVAESYLVLALNGLIMRKFEMAQKMATTAIELNPYNGLCWLAIGLVDLYRGRYQEAIDHFSHVERLNPRDPLQWLFHIAFSLAYFFKGDLELSLTHSQLAQIQPLGKVGGELLNVACLSALDRHHEARLFLTSSPPAKGAWDFVLSRLPFENTEKIGVLVAYINKIDSHILSGSDQSKRSAAV